VTYAWCIKCTRFDLQRKTQKSQKKESVLFTRPPVVELLLAIICKSSSVIMLQTTRTPHLLAAALARLG
jgi:hypothetical protein